MRGMRENSPYMVFRTQDEGRKQQTPLIKGVFLCLLVMNFLWRDSQCAIMEVAYIFLWKNCGDKILLYFCFPYDKMKVVFFYL